MADSGSPAEPVCEPGDVAVTVRWDSDGNGGLRGQVIAENVSGRACRLPGKPTVTPVGMDGEPLPVQTVITLELVRPGYVTVQPGQRAAAPVYWVTWCGERASDRARVSWGGQAVTADVHGPPQPECNGRSGNLSSSWFRLTDLPGDRGRSESDSFAEHQDRATLRCRPNDRGAMMDPVDSQRGSAATPDLAGLARLLADRTRASFCLALLDGRAWTAAELARHAGVAASTATGHLNLMAAGGLLAEERQGRHRYVRLASPEAADLIENLAEFAPRHPAEPRSLAAATRDKALARARTCYDHLAGALGVAITEAMTRRGLLDWEHGLALTGDGQGWFADLGIKVQPATRRSLVRPCLDWTERRPHLAGAAGAALCAHAFECDWVTRIGTGRAVALTGAGRSALDHHLGPLPIEPTG